MDDDDRPPLEMPYYVLPAPPKGWGWDYEGVVRYEELSEQLLASSTPRRVAVADQATAEVRTAVEACGGDPTLAFLTGALAMCEFIHDIAHQCSELDADIDPAALHDLVLFKIEQMMVVFLRIQKDGPSPVLPPL